MRPALARAILAKRLTEKDVLLYAWLTKESNAPGSNFGPFDIDIDMAGAELLWDEWEVNHSLKALLDANALGRRGSFWHFV